MAETRKHIWIIPLITGILVLFAVLITPAAYMAIPYYSISANLWLWGLYSPPPYGGWWNNGDFVPSPLVMIPSIVTTALIILSGTLLIIFAIVGKKRSRLSGIRNISIVSGILILASEIIWLILVPLFFPMEHYWPPLPLGVVLTFWRLSYPYYGIGISIHRVGFGIIGGFIAAVLSFLGVGLAHYYSKQRPEIISKPIEPTLISEEKTPVAKTELLFCTECGAKIEDPNMKFCGNCGHEF
ncbi:MAG: zinc ribbon domain-containing protein [Candidatus Hermodarchaeota archaeon]